MNTGDLTRPAIPAGAWGRFWLRPADPTVLGLTRILCGLVLVYCLLATTGLLQEVYGAAGWLDLPTADLLRKEMPVFPPPEDFRDAPPQTQLDPPNAEQVAYMKRWWIDPRLTAGQGQSLFSLWFHVTDPRWMALAHGLILVVLVLFTLGLGTRVVSVLAWLAVLSYSHRTPPAIFGMDTMASLLLLYLMLSPCGAALSLDRLISRYRVFRRASAERRPLPALLRPAPRASANFALRLLQIHFCMIYLASGLSKLQGAAWWNGTALWQTLANYEFAGPHSAAMTALLRHLVHSRWEWELVLSGMAVFTLVLEIGLPFLIWLPRWRGPLLIGAALLHTGIAMTMGGLTTFSLLMLAIVVAFVPAEVVHRALRALGRGKARLTLAFSSRVPRQARAAALVRTADFWGQVATLDVAAARPAAGAAPPLQLTDGAETLTGYPLFVRLVRSLRVLWPLAVWTWLPGLRPAGGPPAGGAPGRAPHAAGTGATAVRS
jgi:hypothetical protein